MDYYGTLGPACADTDTLCEMFSLGMTGARLNLSHGTLTENGDWVRRFHEAYHAAGKNGTPRLIIDLQGPELRTGTLVRPLTLPDDSIIPLCDKTDPLDGALPLPPEVLDSIAPGDQLSIDDSALLLEITDLHHAKVLRGGSLLSRKSVAILGKEIDSPALTDEDLYNLDHAAQYGVTDLLQPFVRGGKDIRAVRAALHARGLDNVCIIAKIESMTGVEKLPEIIAEADEICIARGDLGNAMPLWLLPGVQRRITKACLAAAKPFMVVTQMLHSMTHSAVPTRAEVSDIYHAVLSGASSVMLTGETAAGDYPVEAIRYLVNTGKEAEKDR